MLQRFILPVTGSILMAFAPAALADTAQDCIDDYEANKAMFMLHSVDAEFECIRLATATNFFGTGSPPLECEGEDEWHLEAKSVVGNPGSCLNRILGAAGEGCFADRVERELPPAEAAQWQNFLMAECRALGTIRGTSPDDAE